MSVEFTQKILINLFIQNGNYLHEILYNVLKENIFQSSNISSIVYNNINNI